MKLSKMEKNAWSARTVLDPFHDVYVQVHEFSCGKVITIVSVVCGRIEPRLETSDAYDGCNVMQYDKSGNFIGSGRIGFGHAELFSWNGKPRVLEFGSAHEQITLEYPN